MDDLISRQAAIDEIYHHFPSLSRSEAAMVLHTVPSADVVEVVRCKECKCYDIINQPYDEGFCRKLNYSVDKDSFCSYGERRTDGDIY